jgi:hypothetical protein
MLGDFGFEAGGKRYTLCYSVNALIEAELSLGMGVADIGAMFAQDVRLAPLRTLFRCGLVEHHPEVTDVEAGRMMTALGIAESAALVGRAFAAAFPTAAAAEPAGGERPLDGGSGSTITGRGLN